MPLACCGTKGRKEISIIPMESSSVGSSFLPQRYQFDSDRAYLSAVGQMVSPTFLPQRYLFDSDRKHLTAIHNAIATDKNDAEIAPPPALSASSTSDLQSWKGTGFQNLMKLNSKTSSSKLSLAPAILISSKISSFQVARGDITNAQRIERDVISAKRHSFSTASQEHHYTGKCDDEHNSNDPIEDAVIEIVSGRVTDFDSLTILAPFAIKWIQRHLPAVSHGNKAMKLRMQQLLGTHFFAANLEAMSLWDNLMEICRSQALETGKVMRRFYEENDLQHVVGVGMDLTFSMGVDVNTSNTVIYNEKSKIFEVRPQCELRRHSSLAVQNRDLKIGQAGIFPSLCFEGATRREMYDEEVFIHLLRLVAMGIDGRYQSAVKDLCNGTSGEHREASIKSYTRMKDKCLSRDDHYYELFPRPSFNLDINRNACTFDDAASMFLFLEKMVAQPQFGGCPLRIKNMFLFDEKRAAEQFEYRCVMFNWVFTPGITYAELVKEAKPIWDRYQNYACAPGFGPKDVDVPWSIWRKQIKVARLRLQKRLIQNRPVQIIVETQLLLRPYLEGRKLMHFLYKILRASDSTALHRAFSTISPNEDVGNKSFQMTQKTARLQVQTFLEPYLGGSESEATKTTVTHMLLKAAKYGHTNALRVMLTFPDVDVNLPGATGRTPLFEAARRGEAVVMSILLRHPGIKVNRLESESTHEAVAPLHIASHNGHLYAVAELLKHRDIQMNQRSLKDGTTALYVACQRGHAEVASLLLKCPDIDVNTSRYGDLTTPLYMAVCRSCSEIVQMLMKVKDCDVNLASLDGTTPLGIALYHTGDASLSSFEQKPASNIKEREERHSQMLKDMSMRLQRQDLTYAYSRPGSAKEERELIVNMLMSHPDIVCRTYIAAACCVVS